MSIEEREPKQKSNLNNTVEEAEWFFKNDYSYNSTTDILQEKEKKNKNEYDINNDKDNDIDINNDKEKDNEIDKEKDKDNEKDDIKIKESLVNNLNNEKLNNDINNKEKYIGFIDDDFSDSNSIILNEKIDDNINIEKLVSYDIPHHIKFNNKSNNNIIYNKKNLINDIMYSDLTFFMLEQNIEHFKNKEEIIEELLNEEIKFNLDSINQLDKKIKKNLIKSIKEYDKSDDYKKKYLYNLSPCFESEYFKTFFLDILYYRRARNDSDSFFKCFMFSYLEKCIIYKKTIRIKILIDEILKNKNKIFYYKNIQVDENETIYILLFILQKLEKDDQINSINYLNRAFCSNDNFCNTLVKFMKIKLSMFIKKNYQYFNSDEIINNHLILNKYYNLNKELNYSGYSKEKVLLMQTEPDLFIYFITPFVFQIDLRIYYIESYGENKLSINNSPFKSEFKIDLIYMNKKYSIAYIENYFQKYSNLLNYDIYNNDIEDTLVSTDDGNILSEKQINYDDVIEICDSNFKCQKCNTITNQIILKKINPNLTICQNCLKISVNDVLLNRINNLIKDGYQNIEYYSRNIQLTDNNNKNKLFLTNLEFKFLFGEKSTILSEILDLLQLSCNLCVNNVKIETLTQMKCGCYICKNCLNDTINNYTDNKIILNDYEKLLYEQQKKEIPKCKCGDKLDINFIISKIYTEDEIKEKEQEAIERLKIKKICLQCQKEFILNKENKNEENKIEENKNEKKIYYDINIQFDINDEKNIFYNCENHIICLECFNKMNLNNKRINEYHEINCKICNKPHKIKINLKSNINKNQKKTHCTCSIF